jgi:ectoine hydroxylase-related dioxygenase (phytanoyl-CoA dioxygenase family)
MAAGLREAGCAVITDLADHQKRQAITSELAEHIDAAEFKTEDDPADFYPGRTRRVTALVARSRAVGDLILDPKVSALCDDILHPNCVDHQLHVTAALVVAPGARAQLLHREEDPFTFFPLPRPNLIVATMWAISDFRADNGATLLVPGSHLWEADRKHTPEEVVAAEMPAGSVLMWLGGTLHGAGANQSNDSRYGVILTYSLGWLRQEENQYLDVPLKTAAQLSPELRKAIGHEMYDALGLYDPSVPRGSVQSKPGTSSYRDSA